MKILKDMLAEQRRNLEDLSNEVQRREVSPARVIRLMKIVSRNVDVLERMAAIIETVGKHSGLSTDKIDAQLDPELPGPKER